MFNNLKFIFCLSALYIGTSSSTWSLASIWSKAPVTPVTTPIKDRCLQTLTEVTSLLSKIDRENKMYESLGEELVKLKRWFDACIKDGAELTPYQEKQLEILIIKWIFRVLLEQIRQYMFHSTLSIDIKKYQLAREAYKAVSTDSRIFEANYKNSMSQKQLSDFRANLYSQSSNLQPTSTLLFRSALTSSDVGPEVIPARVPLIPEEIERIKETTKAGVKQVGDLLDRLQKLGLSNPELTAKFRELIGLKDSFLANSNVTREGANEIELKTIQLAIDILSLSELELRMDEGRGIADDLIREFTKLVTRKGSDPEFMRVIQQEIKGIPAYFVPQPPENALAIVIIKKTLTVLFAKYGQEHRAGIRSKLTGFASQILDQIY